MARNTAYPVFDDYFVYIISEVGTDFVKIGVARNPAARLNDIRAGNHRPLILAFRLKVRGREKAHKIEFAAHRALMEQHLGGEWFSISVSSAIALVEKMGR